MRSSYSILWSDGPRTELWAGRLRIDRGRIFLTGGNGTKTTSRELLRPSLAGVRYAERDEQLVYTRTVRLELGADGIVLVTTLAGSDILGELFTRLRTFASGG